MEPQASNLRVGGSNPSRRASEFKHFDALELEHQVFGLRAAVTSLRTNEKPQSRRRLAMQPRLARQSSLVTNGYTQFPSTDDALARRR